MIVRKEGKQVAPRRPQAFAFYNQKGMFWVRLFGWGFYVKNIRKQPLSFSERQKLVATIKAFGYIIGYLKPLNLG